MSPIIKKVRAFVFSCLGLGAALAPSVASAQAGWPVGGNWVQVAAVTYPGGTSRVSVPFGIEVETSQVGLLVPRYCAPRALSSRAVILDSFGGWTRSVDLRFVRQDYVGANIRAFYTIDDFRGGGMPLVTGVTFGFTQVVPGPLRSCPMTIHVLPGGR